MNGPMQRVSATLAQLIQLIVNFILINLLKIEFTSFVALRVHFDDLRYFLQTAASYRNQEHL